MKILMKIVIISSFVLFAGAGHAQTQAELETQYRSLLMQMIQALQIQVAQLSGTTVPTIPGEPSVDTVVVLPVGVRCMMTYAGETDVIALQTELKRQGYALSTIDGKIGPETRAAVTAFQTAAGITADGLVGNQLRASLARASMVCDGSSTAAPAPQPTTPTPPVSEPTVPTTPAPTEQPTSTVTFRGDEVLSAVRSTSVSNDTAVFTYHLTSQSEGVVYVPGDASAFGIRSFTQAGTEASQTGAVASIVSSAQKIVRADGKTFFMVRRGDTISLRLSIQPGSGVYFGRLEQLQYTTDNASTVLNPVMSTYSFTGEQWKTGVVTLHN